MDHCEQQMTQLAWFQTDHHLTGLFFLKLRHLPVQGWAECVSKGFGLTWRAAELMCWIFSLDLSGYFLRPGSSLVHTTKDYRQITDKYGKLQTYIHASNPAILVSLHIEMEFQSCAVLQLIWPYTFKIIHVSKYIVYHLHFSVELYRQF